MTNQSILIRYLDTVGDGTGSKNGIINTGVLKIKPAKGEIMVLHRMLMHLETTALGGQPLENTFGNQPELTNGLKIQLVDNSGTVTDLCDGEPIKNNSDWAMMCYDVNVSNFGAGNEHVNARWSFDKSGSTVVLNGDRGDELRIIIQDDLSDTLKFLEHKFQVQGYWNKR